MYTLNLNPTLLEIGFVKVRWYGLIFAIGFIIVYLFLYMIAKKNVIYGFDKKNIDNYFLYILIGVIVGARVFFSIFYDFSNLISDPLSIFYIWQGGLSFHGGLVGVVFVTWLFCKKNKINLLSLLDACSVVAIFALMLGRIGNWINGELIGTPFNGKWCVVFSNYDSVCRHPYPIYAFISHLILFLFLGYLLYINRHKLKEYLGSMKLMISFLIGYGLLRIITDIWKVDSIFLGVKMGQWLSLVMVVVGVLLMIKQQYKRE